MVVLTNYNKIEIILKEFNKKEVAHCFSIILRIWYERENIKLRNKNISFELTQMDGFSVAYNETYILNIKNNEYKINDIEMNKLVEKIYKYYEITYPINYDYKLIDPVYFSLFFYDLLDKIVNVKYDTIRLDDIRLLRYKSKAVSLKESERYKALLNKNYKMFSPFSSNLVTDTPRERLENILESVKKNKYGYNNKYAIFYNDEPYIRDGQHRVSVLKYLYGNIEIKIIRFYLKDNYFYE